MLDADLKNPVGEADRLIKDFEGCSLVPYLCPAGKWTIGYGATTLSDGTRVTEDTSAITQDQADALLSTEIQKIRRTLLWEVDMALTPGQEAALISFIYNVGTGAFANSTMLKKLNAGDYAGAAAEFPRWVHAGRKMLPGLVRRREAERRVFMGG